MKKISAIILSFVLLFSLSACASQNNESGKESDTTDKLNIVCTIFPIYDWIREIAGTDNASITMLLDSGVDLHSYQPTADDLIKISGCDLFIYVGGESDSWVEDVLKNTAGDDMTALSLLDAIGSAAKTEEVIDGMEQHEEEEDEEEYDEHIWLSLKNAQICVKAIAENLAEKDADGADAYVANSEAYLEKLSALDAKYEDAASKKQKDTVLFADRYPFRYLFDDYGINAYAAFSGCSAESEASFSTISFLADKINSLGLSTVLITESSDGKIASTVINNTEDKNMQVLTMDSLQSQTKSDAENGASYLSIMEKNLDVFIKALA